MELLESLQWRYATKKMNGEKIPQDKLDRILQATKLAPSSYGLTPYKVIVVETEELKEGLKNAAYGQTQLTDSSQVLVFATWNSITEGSVDYFIETVANERGITSDLLQDYSGMIKGTLNMMSEDQKITWAQKQAYIALGFALVAAATEGVDSTPMEGFNPQLVDMVLNLGELGLKSVALLPLGYRDSENDYLANLKKVRWDDKDFFVKK
jgi:nitroreductase